MPPKQKRITPYRSDFLDQTFKEDYEKRGVFIEKLIERLTQYGEERQKLLAAYTDRTDLPEPKLKTEAKTESQTSAYFSTAQLRRAQDAFQTDSESDIDTLKANLQHYHDEMKKMSENDIDTLKANLRKHKNELKEECDKEMKALTDENASLKAAMLSLEKEARLTDSSPGMRDISDPNRPLRLAEKFSELYDNEWTDAMEEMAEKMSDETKVIKLLADIVCDAYKFCLYRSDKIMDKINSTLDGFLKEFGSSQEVSKTNKDYRKQLAVHVVKYIEQDFAKEMRIKMKTKVGERTEAYTKRCVSVCWFMTVQDPKVVMTLKQPELFDEDLYRPYTKRGKRMDYLVWPALYLHEGGPLIGKGVAQGK